MCVESWRGGNARSLRDDLWAPGLHGGGGFTQDALRVPRGEHLHDPVPRVADVETAVRREGEAMRRDELESFHGVDEAALSVEVGESSLDEVRHPDGSIPGDADAVGVPEVPRAEPVVTELEQVLARG